MSKGVKKQWGKSKKKKSLFRQIKGIFFLSGL